MRTKWTPVPLLLLALCAPAFGGPVSLFQFLFNVNGSIYDSFGTEGPSTLPANFNTAAWDPSSGLGTITITFSAPGAYDVVSYFDLEIREGENGFTNEFGTKVGAAPAGLSWEIGEPGFITPPPNIYTRTLAGNLANSNGLPGPALDDPAMAIGWNFNVGAAPVILTLKLSTTAPAGGFYLVQTDPDALLGDMSVYFSSTLASGPIPEPGGVVLIATGLGLAWLARRRKKSAGLILLALLVALPLVTQAAPPVVKVVPWVASDPFAPHDTYSGKTVMLKGTSDVSGPTIEYTWDFADGSPVQTGKVLSPPAVANDRWPHAIDAAHAYTAALNTVFVAKLTVKNTATGESTTKDYRIQVRAKNLGTEVNIAIDEGLWFLHKSMIRTTIGALPSGHWNSCPPAGIPCNAHHSLYYAINSANVNAFFGNGHLETGASTDPYTETVQRAMRTVFNQLSAVAIPASQTNPKGTFNPDTNGNGLGVGVAQGAQFYQGGMIVDAIIASGTTAATAPTGPVNILGRTYQSIVQDMLDYYYYCQYDAAPGGAWRYNCQDFPDNSAAQWGAIAIIPGSRIWGLPVPAPVKLFNVDWLTYSQHAAGYFGYTSTGPVWGPYATLPSGMVQLAMDGLGRGDPPWDKAETYMRDHFCDGGGATTNPRAYYYGLFSFNKAMLLHDSNGDNVGEPLTDLRSMTAGVTPIDWYAAEAALGAPCDGVARSLVNAQNAAGYWYGHNYWGDQYPFETAFAIIMLRQSIPGACVSNVTARPKLNKVELRWTPTPGTDAHAIYRGTVNGGPYVKIAQISGTTGVYVDPGPLTIGTTYYYVVREVESGIERCQSNQASAKPVAR